MKKILLIAVLLVGGCAVKPVTIDNNSPFMIALKDYHKACLQVESKAMCDLKADDMLFKYKLAKIESQGRPSYNYICYDTISRNTFTKRINSRTSCI